MKTKENEILDRVKLLINYNLSKTLNENIFEQSTNLSSVSTPASGGIAQYADPSYKGRRRGGGFGENDSIPITAKDISEGLLKVREFLFSTTGMVTQVAISILGVEIGAPIAVAALDIAILINDLVLMVQNWEDKPFENEENWFMYHWEKNIGFKNSVEDIAFLLTAGTLRLIGKTAKGAWSMLKSLFGPKGSFKTWITGAFETIKSLFKKVQNIPIDSIKKWANKNIIEAEKAINLLGQGYKSVSKSVLKQVPKSIAGSFIVYGMIECVFPKIFEDESLKNGLLISSIIEENENFKFDGTEKFEFPKENCITKNKSPFILINGKKYVFVDLYKQGNKLKSV
jgi:hypothetical protein